MHIKAVVCAAIALALVAVAVTACGKAAETASSGSEAATVPTLTVAVTKNTKFDAADLAANEADFDAAGFAFGDSCDLSFSNGYTLTDVPYYNGYYVKTGKPVITAYPNFDYVQIANNNRDFWTPAGLEDGCTVTVTLNTAGKYLSTYEALGQSYSLERDDYESDIEFANFRAMSGGNLKENFLYRGASPVDNCRGRAAYADALLKQYGITCVLDLADTDEDLAAYMAAEDFSSAYTQSLYESGRVVLLNMGSNYDADGYKASLAQGLRHLTTCGGPAYIHCMEGKDRTGFVCLLLEALCGASYDEMCADYMTTYANYYGITKDGTPDRYDAVVDVYFNSFMQYLSGLDDVDALYARDYTDDARAYLAACGMTDEEIDALTALISQ